MSTKTLFKDVIPYRAGILRVTPLDSNFVPIESETYTTQRDFLTSTQRSTTFAYETFYSVNGEPSDYISQRRENLTLTTQIRDPAFEALVMGKSQSSEIHPFLCDIEIEVPKGSTRYSFSNKSAYPVPLNTGKYHIEIRDSLGNRYFQSEAITHDHQFKYDPETHSIEFYETDEARILHCSYYRTGSEQESYEYPAEIRNRIFMVEAYGEVQSAVSGIKQCCYTCIKRATLSSEISGATLQKSISKENTYTFSSAPVNRGESACIEIISTLD